MTTKDLLQYLPEAIRYERVPLADEANALLPWQEAINRYQKLEYDSDGLAHLLYGTTEWETTVPPTEEDWRQVEAWIDANEDALKLIDAGLARERLQLPSQARLTPELTPIATPTMELRDFGRLLCLRRVMASRRQDPTAAVAETVRQLRMSAMILRGEGFVIDLLMGTSFLSSAFDSVCESTKLKLSTAAFAEIEGCLTDVPDVREAIWAATRTDVSEYALSTLSMIPQTNEACTLIRGLLPLLYSTSESVKSLAEIMGEPAPSDAILQQREAQLRAQLERLLKGHPLLFDPEATARLMGETALANLQWLEQEDAAPLSMRARVAEWFRRRWRPTADELLEDAWPFALQPGYDFEAFGDDEFAVSKRAENIKFYREGGFSRAQLAMPTERRINVCRDLLRQIDNPVGRLVAHTLVSFVMPKMLLDKLQTELRSAQEALHPAA